MLVFGDETNGKSTYGGGAKNASFEPSLFNEKRSFYQDRLSTNIGKALKKEGVLCREVLDDRAAE